MSLRDSPPWARLRDRKLCVEQLIEPNDHRRRALLAGMIAWQVRAIIRSEYPGIRATQALAATTPVFLVLFASASFILSLDNPATFTERLSRSDVLYFTVTIFSSWLRRHYGSERHGPPRRHYPDAAGPVGPRLRHPSYPGSRETGQGNASCR